MAKIYGNRWKITQSLGEGGQAHTFLVSDETVDEDAIYVLKRLKNMGRLERFENEIQAVSRLNHENIISLVDYDLGNESPYLVMDFCRGGNLRQATPFWIGSPTKAFEIFRQVCRGVAYAHSQGIIHRDIKPDNIFLRTGSGPAVVGDFGICYIEKSKRLTITEEAVGPILFMAPETEDGRSDKISSKADTYSLGKLLYWLLSGGRMFSREKHRLPEWDLRELNEDSILGWNKAYLEHANELLDLMITEDVALRRTVENILILSRQKSILIEKEFNAIGANVPQRCIYCGNGKYVIKASKSGEVNDFGFTPYSGSQWRILVCNRCGNVQLFRIESAEYRDRWSLS